MVIFNFMKNTIIYLFVGLLNAQVIIGQESANDHMNSMDFDELTRRFESPARKDWIKPDYIIKSLGNIKNKTIVDIGAGTGYFSFKLAKRGAKVIAADIDDRFIDYMENRRKEFDPQQIDLEIVLISSSEIQLSEKVDVLFLVNTYHHIENRINYFKNAKNNLITGGKIVIVDFIKEETPFGPPVEHRVSEFEAINELKEAGFTKFQIDYNLEYHYILFAESYKQN